MSSEKSTAESRGWTDPSTAETRASCTRLAEALASTMERSVSKKALAEALASKAVARGIVNGQTDAQIEADLMAELHKWEQIATLRQTRKMAGEIADEMAAESRAKGYSDRLILEGLSRAVFAILDKNAARPGDGS